MIYTPNTTMFEKLASLFDAHQDQMDEQGYDLTELEAIHITHAPEGGGDITLIFDIHTMPILTFPYKSDGNIAAVLNAE